MLMFINRNISCSCKDIKKYLAVMVIVLITLILLWETEIVRLAIISIIIGACLGVVLFQILDRKYNIYVIESLNMFIITLGGIATAIGGLAKNDIYAYIGISILVLSAIVSLRILKKRQEIAIEESISRNFN